MNILDNDKSVLLTKAFSINNCFQQFIGNIESLVVDETPANDSFVAEVEPRTFPTGSPSDDSFAEVSDPKTKVETLEMPLAPVEDRSVSEGSEPEVRSDFVQVEEEEAAAEFIRRLSSQNSPSTVDDDQAFIARLSSRGAATDLDNLDDLVVVDNEPESKVHTQKGLDTFVDEQYSAQNEEAAEEEVWIG